MEFYEIIPGALWQSGSLGGRVGWAEAEKACGRTPDALIDLCGDFDQLWTPPGLMLVAWYIEDGPLPDLDAYWALIDLGAHLIDKGKVIVCHCAAGINRSGLVSAGLVYRSQRVTGAEAVAQVREARPGALINGAFRGFLEALP